MWDYPEWYPRMNEPDIDRIEVLLGEPKQQARLRALGITGTPKVELTDRGDDGNNDIGIDFIFTHPNTGIHREFRFTIPLSEFPGCCGGIVIHHLAFYPEYLRWSMTATNNKLSHRGIGSFFFDLLVQVLREGAASRENGGMLFAATTQEQVAGTRMLRRRRWTRTATFRNPNTGNMVTMWCKKLTTAKYDKNGRNPNDYDD